MPVVYDTATKTARMLAVRDRIDSGSGVGVAEIWTANMGTVLARFDLAKPCGSVVNGVLSFAGFPRTDASADASGTPALACIRASDGTQIVGGLTVGLNSGDVAIDDDFIRQGQTVVLKSLSLLHA